MTKSQLKIKAIKLVKDVLYAKRNQNWKAEQRSYKKFLDFCEQYNINHIKCFEGAKIELQNSVGAIMNGII